MKINGPHRTQRRVNESLPYGGTSKNVTKIFSAAFMGTCSIPLLMQQLFPLEFQEACHDDDIYENFSIKSHHARRAPSVFTINGVFFPQAHCRFQKSKSTSLPLMLFEKILTNWWHAESPSDSIKKLRAFLASSLDSCPDHEECKQLYQILNEGLSSDGSFLSRVNTLCKLLSPFKKYVNLVDTDGNTPLHYAFKDNVCNLALYLALLHYGSDPNKANSLKVTPTDLLLPNSTSLRVALCKRYGPRATRNAYIKLCRELLRNSQSGSASSLIQKLGSFGPNFRLSPELLPTVPETVSKTETFKNCR